MGTEVSQVRVQNNSERVNVRRVLTRSTLFHFLIRLLAEIATLWRSCLPGSGCTPSAWVDLASWGETVPRVPTRRKQ